MYNEKKCNIKSQQLVQGKAKDASDSATNDEPVGSMPIPKTEEEKKKDKGPGNLKPTAPYKGGGSPPEEFDWRNVAGVNYTGEIRNQEACGSCYTFTFI